MPPLDPKTLERLTADLQDRIAKRSGHQSSSSAAARSSFIAAAYWLGASQTQLAQFFDISKSTVRQALARKLSPMDRANARPSPRWQRAIPSEGIEQWWKHYESNRVELEQLNAIRLAIRIAKHFTHTDLYEEENNA